MDTVNPMPVGGTRQFTGKFNNLFAHCRGYCLTLQWDKL